jgi:hypothetical protein
MEDATEKFLLETHIVKGRDHRYILGSLKH